MNKNLRNQRHLSFSFFMLALCSAFNPTESNAQTTEPATGERAEWMRGTYGLNWKPEETANGNAESLYIDDFLEQIEGLRAVDYIQVHLGESYTTSAVHLGPHDILESLWQGDTDENGSPINLIVPRAASGRDPFLDMLNAVKAKGLKTQVYVNSSNLLLRRDIVDGEEVTIPNPDNIPNITERWKEWCDTNAKAQAYITYMKSKSWFNIDGDYPNRKYMFCYAKFILQDYTIRYGELVDAWIFDSGKMMYLYNGDDKDSEEIVDQYIYKAFADAVHAGNPDAAVSFNNSTGSKEEDENPYSVSTLYNDYMFGHPFNGGKYLGENENNERMMTWSNERNGYAQTNDPLESRTWDDKVIAHFDPPMSATSWNGGTEAGLTDEQLLDWYGPYLLNGAALSLGIPLESQHNYSNLFAKDFAMAQLELLDAYLMEHQEPGKANWSRQETILTDATIGQKYFHKLRLGEDFWDPEGDEIISLYPVQDEAVPSWLTVKRTGDNFLLSGVVTDTKETSYTFRLRIKNDAGLSTRWVTLDVTEGTTTEYVTAQVRATENTNYGIGEVATMLSDVLTAPDGLATYQVELKVTPPSNKAISSGASGGDATAYSWGMGDGSISTTNDQMFNGDDEDWVENIGDIVIKNFEANGSLLAIDELVFESVTIANAQSSGDALRFDFNNGSIKNVSNIFTNIEVVNLGIENATTPITDFSFGIGSENVTDQAKNKWSVEGINVRVSFKDAAITTVYQHCNYGGTSIALREGEYSNIASEGFNANWLSSLVVPEGYQVILYQDTNFEGDSIAVMADDNCLIDNDFNDKCSSLKIEVISKISNCSTYTVPTQIEAEDFCKQQGVQTENSGDTSGGENIGYVTAGDWMKYQIYVATAAEYQVKYRVAAKNTDGGTIEMQLDGAAIGSIDVHSTGDWQTYTTISHRVNLPAGNHIIKIYAEKAGWNLNYFKFNELTNASLSAVDLTTESVSVLSNDTVEKTLLYPNPASDFVNINIIEGEDVIKLQMYDASGRVIEIHDINYTLVQNNTFSITTSHLETGIYTIQLDLVDGTSEMHQLIVNQN